MSFDWATDFEMLMRAVLDGRATLAEQARLDELLATRPEALDAYVQLMSLDTMLQAELNPARLASPSEAAPKDRGAPAAGAPLAADEGEGVSGLPGAVPPLPLDGLPGPVVDPGGGFFTGHVGLLALLAGGLLTGLLVVWAMMASRDGPGAAPQMAQEPAKNAKAPRRNEESSHSASPSPDRRSAAPVARLVGARDCRWNGAEAVPAVDGPVFAGRPLHLAAGVAEIDFCIGAKVVLQGPAAFEALSATAARLSLGKATVEIKTDEARNFTIHTPTAEYVDRGTEFGVEVAPGGGNKVHVFQGQVDVTLAPGEGRPAGLSQRLLASAGARIEPDQPGMVLVEDTGECFIRSLDEADRDQHVVAYWRFEDRPVGILLPDTGGNRRPVCATADSSFHGNDLYVAMARNRPTFAADVPAAAVPQTGMANRSCLDTSRATTDVNRLHVYTHSRFSHAAPLDIQKIAPAQWTIEASVRVAKLFDKPQGFLGRDANFTYDSARAPARLSFQINAQQRFGIRFYDMDGRLHEAVAEDLPVEAGRWYHVAATSDGRVLLLYVDALDGAGYVERAATALPDSGSTALGKGRDNAEWTIGRAGNAGDPADWLRFWGWIDEVRISDVARPPKDFLFVPRDPNPVAEVAGLPLPAENP